MLTEMSILKPPWTDVNLMMGTRALPMTMMSVPRRDCRRRLLTSRRKRVCCSLFSGPPTPGMTQTRSMSLCSEAATALAAQHSLPWLNSP